MNDIYWHYSVAVCKAPGVNLNLFDDNGKLIIEILNVTVQTDGSIAVAYRSRERENF